MKNLISTLLLILLIWVITLQAQTQTSEQITLTILYDNYVHQTGTTSDWGFACFIEGTAKTILFDTGNNGEILQGNIDTLKIKLANLDAIVISHNHGDHTRGLNSVLEKKSGIPVYFGNSFPESFSQNISEKNATPIRVDEPVQICEHVFSTGEIQGVVNEQALILDTENGLVVITGCSHPGIVTMLKRTEELHNKNIHLVFGGFHLMNHSDSEVNQIIEEFRELGVEKCGATHCTGDRAIELFKEAFGENYVPMGVGQVIKLSFGSTGTKKTDEIISPNSTGFKLEQNFPNPFNASTTIQFTVDTPALVNLKIFNLAGQQITSLVNSHQSAGEYCIKWNPEALSSGSYFYALNVNHFSERKKMIFLK